MEEDNQDLSKRERQKLNREKKSSEEKKPNIQNKLLVVGAIIVAAVGIFWLMYRGGSSQPPEVQEVLPPTEVTAEDHVKGPEEAVVTLIEYGDFQCPACATYLPVVKELTNEFPDGLRVVYRHFPLRSLHRHAQIAAQAAESAGQQGKFWEMHDILYERQTDWANTRDPRSIFKEYAEELALNIDQFDSYMNSAEAKAKVDAQYNAGFAAGVDSTPSFYLNGTKIANPPSRDAFKQLIQQIIDDSKVDQEATPEAEETTPNGDITPQL